MVPRLSGANFNEDDPQFNASMERSSSGLGMVVG
jgi:hypothetical protein